MSRIVTSLCRSATGVSLPPPARVPCTSVMALIWHSQLGQMSAMTLVQGTRAGGGKDTPVADRHKDVTILDIYQNAASAKIYASGWVDYLHLAKWNGRWVIVNVLWELHPR